MTTYCLSSASRTRPSAFILESLVGGDVSIPARRARGARSRGSARMGGDERLPQQPMPPNVSVDTPDDEPLGQVNDGDPAAPLLGPSKKRVPDEERGLP